MIYVMSDIHGNKEKYDAMLQKINLQDDDKLIILGDILDRGPKSLEILDDVMSRDNVEFMLGNHEYAMLKIWENTKQYEKTKGEEYKKQIEVWQKYIFDPMAGGKKSYELFFKTLPKKDTLKYMRFFKKCEIDKYLKVNGKKFYLVHGSVALNDT